MKYFEIAVKLKEALQLDLPPVAVTRVAERPQGVEELKTRHPSACSLWRAAEHQVFFASAEAHMDCPIGAMVMGLELSTSKQGELMALVSEMIALCYIREDEIPHIPRFAEPAAGVVYGPLAEFPLTPGVVIVWTTPAQGLLLQEMAGGSLWSESPPTFTFGRPGCCALPSAYQRDKSVLSLGCIGMRTFTEIPDDRFLVALPVTALANLEQRLEQTVASNLKMEELYLSRKSQ